MSKADCRKFMPNIFNKSKCTNCFKPKEEHSEEALENNRASRKVAKCGYLFVAPDWDFSNPINRTKRWQRRWFVLYDDGELTYSVDEHPETVPQAIIDMNRVMEVSEAEEVTGHPFSLALTAPDRVHFVKGVSREESKWWFDILSMFPRTNVKTGRHKRNATFPGSKATTIPTQSTAPNSPSLAVQPYQTPPLSRPRFHSCHAETGRPSSSTLPNIACVPVKEFIVTNKDLNVNEDGDIIPVKESSLNVKEVILQKEVVIDKEVEEKCKTRRVIRREIRGARSARCNSEILNSMLPSVLQSQQQPNNKSFAVVLPTATSSANTRNISSGAVNNLSSATEKSQPVMVSSPISKSNTSTVSVHSPFYLYMADVPRSRHYESLESLQSDRMNLSTTQPKPRLSSSKEFERESDSSCKRERPLSLQDLGSRNCNFSSEQRCEEPVLDMSGKPRGEAVRGVPDGCGLEPVSSFCSPLPARRSSLSTAVDDGTNVKKGWLMKLTYSGDWSRQWFVLRGTSFTCFRDPAAEDAAAVIDVIDLGLISSVEMNESDRNYSFQLIGLDGKKHSFAALTSGIRSHWLQSLLNITNQNQNKSQQQSKISSVSEKENVDPVVSLKKTEDELDDTSLELYDVSRNSSSDELDSQSSHTPALASLPPSPPLNRTPMSKVKERDRSRSSSRSRSRHRSLSPPDSISRGSPIEPPPPLMQPLAASLNTYTIESIHDSSHVQLRLEAAKGEITKLLNERKDHEKEAKQQLNFFSQKLKDKEVQITHLLTSLEMTKAENLHQQNSLKAQLEMKENELQSVYKEAARMRDDIAELKENLKRERSEVYKLRDVAQELRSLLESRNDTLSQLQMKTDEAELLKQQLKAAQQHLSETQERLQRGIDENEGLFARLREIEDSRSTGRAFGTMLRRSRSSTGSMPLPLQISNNVNTNKKSLPRLDSLSDLSNIDYDLDLENIDRENLVDEYCELRTRFEKAVNEIRALKRELKETQSTCDSIEVAHVALKQQWQVKEDDYVAQLSLMAARIQDLTTKMAVADKQVRQLRIKLGKTETREKRRTQSLKGRESFQLNKEIEEKLVELEQRMATVVSSSSSDDKGGSSSRMKKGFEEPTKSFRLRRKSLEDSGSYGNSSVKVLLRVDTLEQQLNNRGVKKTPTMERKSFPHAKSPQGKPPRSSPVRTGAIKRSDSMTSTDTENSCANLSKFVKLAQHLDQCVLELELILNSNKVDGENVLTNMKEIQQQLADFGKSKHITLNNSQSQIDRIQELLRTRLTELKARRDHLVSIGKWDSYAANQIAAGKLALIVTVAEQLFSNVKCPERKDILRDAHWTVQKLGWLKQKLRGIKSIPALEQSTVFGTYCSALTERLSSIVALTSSFTTSNASTVIQDMENTNLSCNLPSSVAEQLTREECELSAIFTVYKEEKIEELARLLALETLRMGDNAATDNQLVEEIKVREAWLQAQDVANKELVDSEVRQAMIRMAEVFAEDVATEERLASTLLLWPIQQMQFETRCQVVEEVLRQEMEEAVLMLSNAYEQSLQQMRQQPQESQQLDGDLESLLSEFAEMVAHKALVDGHIAALQGEIPSPIKCSNSESNISQVISQIQQTESIIVPLLNTDHIPMALNCSEIAAILHHQLVEARRTKFDESGQDSKSHSGCVSEEVIRQKYQTEIEQLRALTEKGMAAMESSHKRIIAELEDKHKQDLARLQVEKERALAEETQATLAALDAMRKAHEAEVQREISRFKDEFVRQMAMKQESNNQRELELQEIRREILSLSEKYSHKCLESAALEQKVSSLSQQLTVTQRQICDLDSRNQQLRVFLEKELNDSSNLNSSDQLRAKDCQLLSLQEDIAELQYCLRESQNREEELATLARQLGQYLRTERPLRSDEVGALRNRLEELLLIRPGDGRSNAQVSSNEDCSKVSPPRELNRIHYVRSKDLTRSPSCPRLSGFLSLTPRLLARPVLKDHPSSTNN